MTQTAGLTQAIISYLNYNGFRVWRNNNAAIYSVKQQTFRKNPTTLKGVFDIIGFRKTDGLHIEVEVKTGKDKMSEWQLSHAHDLTKAKCITIIAKDFNQFEREIKPYIK